MTVRARLQDVSELSRALGSAFDIDVLQLTAGPFSGQLTSWPLAGAVVTCGRLERSVQISGVTGQDVTLLVSDPNSGGRLVLNGVTLERQDVLATPKATEHSFVLPEAFQGVVLQVNHPWLREQTFPPRQFLARARVLNSFALSLAGLGGELEEASRLALGARCVELILGSLSADCSERVESLSCRRRAALGAADVIHHDPQAPLTIATLCRQTQVGERTLRQGFLEVFGVPPLEYVTTVRLNLVRRRLRAGGPALTVTQAATEQGFWHLARFAGYYRRLFGELPSQTLRG